MPVPTPISNRYRITPLDHGQIRKLGNAAIGEVGTWSIQFVPDASFEGAFIVKGRIDHEKAQDDDVPYLPVRYRAAFLNSADADYSLVAAEITSGSLIDVPANGKSIALLISCTAGYGWLYSTPLHGPSL
jgi:hypothetical protein